MKKTNKINGIQIPSIVVSFDNTEELPICVKLGSKMGMEDPEPDGECITNQCNIQNFYGCHDETGYFKINNLFSELTNDYQRAVIRQNLGIGDSQSLLWGKIQGNLANQQDLYKFVKEVAQADTDKILSAVNNQLEYWANHIESAVESRASNIKSFQLRPMYGSTLETPIDVLVSWEYANEVEGQKINDYEISPTTRNFLVQGVTETKDITLSYYLNGIWLSRTVTFKVHAPTFYGFSSNFEECQSTSDDKFKIEAGEDQYIYVLTSVPSDLAVNGMIGGFEDQAPVYVHERKYYVYKSANPGLGVTTITRYDSE